MKKTLTALTILLAVSAAQAGFLYWSFAPDGDDYTVALNWDTTAPTEWDSAEYGVDDNINDTIVELDVNFTTVSEGVTLSDFDFHSSFDEISWVSWDSNTKTVSGYFFSGAATADVVLVSFKYSGPDNVTFTADPAGFGNHISSDVIARGPEFSNSNAGSFVVPEPATMVIFGLGGLVLSATRRRSA
jgi:hypothetical protein